MIHNLTGFPLRFGSADSEPLPVDGKAIVRAENVPAAPLVLDDGRSFAAVVDAQPTGIIGLDTDAYGPEDGGVNGSYLSLPLVAVVATPPVGAPLGDWVAQ